MKEWLAAATSEDSETAQMSEQELGLIVWRLQEEVQQWKIRATKERHSRETMSRNFLKEITTLKNRLEKLEAAPPESNGYSKRYEEAPEGIDIVMDEETE